ncbi:MAG: translation initiation factor IF-2 [Candidatus Altiarchaeota archaeon]|nr:translation initiation factor IF-2 [Candidatus Altiarchaeota archaeon]
MRQPIVAVLGHVDHGKTQFLDYIRQSRVQQGEAGGITQHIGATEIPASYIKKFCKNMLDKLKIELKIPGLLFIDTPGHAAFTNLRKRGGSVADLAILVIDIMSGVKPQTIESIEILKQYKVPFIVAANKVDILPDYQSKEGSFLNNLKQSPQGTVKIETKLYEIVNKLQELGFDAERIDRIEDFTNQVVVVPTSGFTGEGIIDVLALLAGLSQKYLDKKLELTGKTKGNILEIKQQKGLGAVADIILYDGKLKEGDTIVVSGADNAIVTKIKCIMKPEALKEIRTEKKFLRVKEVNAAAGIRIHAPQLENAVAGSSVLVADTSGLKEAVKIIEDERQSIEFSTDDVGIVVKSDTLGTLEALVKMLQERNIKVRRAHVGDISRSDVMEADRVKCIDPFYGVIIGLNIKNQEAQLCDEKKVKAITGDIIYRVIEDYETWVEDEKESLRKNELNKLPRPSKFLIVPGYVFRNSGPAVVGVEVIGGTLKNNVEVMKEDGMIVGDIKQIEVQGESVKEAKVGAKLAVSIDGPTVGRQIKEGDKLWVSLTEKEFKGLNKYLDLLDASEKEMINEIVQIKRQEKKRWGMLDI